MLFTGQSQHSIDPKLRLAVPAKYRNQWDPLRDGSAWYGLPWPTGHLRLYTENTFAALSPDAGTNALRPADDDAKEEANFFSFAERLEMDSAGRINLNKRHLELAGLGNEVVIVGARNRLEIHDVRRWEADERTRFEALTKSRHGLPAAGKLAGGA